MSTSKKRAQPDPSEAAFAEQLGELLRAHRGKFALFAEGAFVDAFDTFESAYNAGVDRYGLEPFFVGRVERDQPPEQVPALQHGLIRADL